MELWINDNIKLWECKIMKDLRISNYERYENINLWKIWECKNYERYENVKLWKIWEYKMMNDMRI